MDTIRRGLEEIALTPSPPPARLPSTYAARTISGHDRMLLCVVNGQRDAPDVVAPVEVTALVPLPGTKPLPPAVTRMTIGSAGSAFRRI